jgi:hypothetical protein
VYEPVVVQLVEANAGVRPTARSAAAPRMGAKNFKRFLGVCKRK